VALYSILQLESRALWNYNRQSRNKLCQRKARICWYSGTPPYSRLTMQFNGPLHLGCATYRFEHNDLELRKDPRYHLARYLEAEGVQITNHLRKQPCIDEIYQNCKFSDEDPGNVVVPSIVPSMSTSGSISEDPGNNECSTSVSGSNAATG
jgi:hypothetical protein